MDSENKKQNIREQAKALLFRLRDAIIGKPWLVPIALVAALALWFFWYIFVALLAIFAVLLLAIKIKFREPSMKELLEEHRVLEDTLKIAEAKLLQHKLDLNDYQELTDKTQKQLVEIEVRLSKAEEKEKQKTKPPIQEVSSRKRHLLKELLEHKKTIQEEIRIAETKYFKRKINGITYKQILLEKQKQLIELEAAIKKVYADENIEQIKKDLAEKLKKLGESAEKKQEKYTEEIAEDVSDQAKRSENSEEGQETNQG